MTIPVAASDVKNSHVFTHLYLQACKTFIASATAVNHIKILLHPCKLRDTNTDNVSLITNRKQYLGLSEIFNAALNEYMGKEH